MATGSKSKGRGGGKEEKRNPAADPDRPAFVPFFPRRDHSARDLRAWAKSTGFVSYSSETSAANYTSEFDLEKRESAEDDGKHEASPPAPAINPGLLRNRGTGLELNSAYAAPNPKEHNEIKHDERKEEKSNGGDDDGGGRGPNLNGAGRGVPLVTPFPAAEQKKDDEIDSTPFDAGEDNSAAEEWQRLNDLKYGLIDNPGCVRLLYYSLQHYLSMAGSLIFVPLIIVPAMGGSDKDTATVISTMLLISGITTILHCYFGTRLPLVQGSSFVFLAPVMVIVNSQEYRNLSVHKFRHIMRELQGAIVVGSVVQCILGFTGLMSLILRLISPLVVCPTVVAVGLAFFSYAFPQAGSCVEISVPLVILVLLFSLYLRGVSVFGQRLFKIYAVPLSVVIVWTLAFFLTAGGAYNYKGCTTDIPASNILADACRKHVYTMQRCRTDVSDAWSTASWIRVPYPLQWGVPIFRVRTSLIMIVVSLIASVDSIGTYHSTSCLVTTKPPTAGIVSRGIAVEGFCSVLAGLWGSGTGATTLIENVHTITTTKVANRKTVQIGASFLIIFSFFGKIGAVLASIPVSLAASILCFMWGLVVALGLSTLQHSHASSSRSMIIVGVSVFLGLSVPAFVQQYEPVSSLVLPGYLVPYAAASNGPVKSGSPDFNYAVNGLLSVNMVVTFLIALVLDATVPASRDERVAYTWTHADDMAADVFLREDYALPRRVPDLCSWAKCLCPC